MNEISNTEGEQPEVGTQPEPKVMQQHEINALVGGAKQKGREQGKLEGYQQARAELMTQGNPTNANMQQPPAPMNDDARLRQVANEEFSRLQSMAQANWEAQQKLEVGNRILNDLKTKASAAKAKIEDYDKVVHQEFANFPKTAEVLALASEFDNAGEMLYDMAKNPGKIAQITWMAREGRDDPAMRELAFKEMKRLSDSIKVNEMATNQPQPRTPLSQVTPSNVGVGKTDYNVSSNDFVGRY